MTKDTALTLARDWIAERPADRPVSAGKMISIIDRALAQPELPWVELTIDEFLSVFAENDVPEVSGCRNSRSAQRSWVGLTVDELIDLERKHLSHENLTRAIEAKLKEKNHV